MMNTDLILIWYPTDIEIDEHSAVEALADLTSECKNALQQELQQLERKDAPKKTEMSVSTTKIEQYATMPNNETILLLLDCVCALTTFVGQTQGERKR